MAIINFPPTAGQPTDGSFTYTFDGVLYSWTGSYWSANSQSGFDNRYVEVAGDVMTGNLTVPSLNGGQLAGFRNQIANGAMLVAQRGAGPITTGSQGGTYTCVDRFTVDDVVSSQISVSDLPGFSKALNIINGGRYKVRQAIELPNDGRNCQFGVGSTWTASLWSTANISSGNLSLVFADEHSGGNFVEAASTETWTALETVNSWTRYKATITITGTPNPTNQCLLTEFNVAEGSYTGVQFEPGSVATPFEHRPIGTELALCQRYYVTESGVDYPLCRAATTAGTANNDQNVYVNIQFDPTMRTTPTVAVTVYNNPTPLTVSPHPGNFRVKVGSFNTNASTSLTDYTADAEL